MLRPRRSDTRFASSRITSVFPYSNAMAAALLSLTPARPDYAICVKLSPRLAAAMDPIGSLGEGGVLSVSGPPSFAAKWLLPRLDSFEQRSPGNRRSRLGVDGDRRLQARSNRRRNRLRARRIWRRLPGKAADGNSNSGLQSRPGWATWSCEPHAISLYAGPTTTARRLIPSCPNRDSWMRAASVHDANVERGPRFNQSNLVIELAILGRGVALAKVTLWAGRYPSRTPGVAG